jgi:hypothetical protein
LAADRPMGYREGDIGRRRNTYDTGKLCRLRSLVAVLFDHVTDVNDTLVAGAGALFGGWVRGVR